MTRRGVLVLLTMVVSLAACGEPAPTHPQLVTQWVRATLALQAGERLEPLVAARISAYASLALYEGFAAAPDAKLRSLAGQLNGLWNVPRASRDKPVDGATVAAEAERVVLDSLFSEGSTRTRRTIDSLAQAQIAHRRSAGVGAAVSERSVAHGRALGQIILAWAATDGFVATRGRSWRPPTAAALWVHPTTQRVARQSASQPEVVLAGSSPPGSATNPVARGPKTTLPLVDPTRPTEPYWGRLRTFAIRNGDECAPPRPPIYSERRGSDFWKMGKELHDSVTTLTPAKRELALFWLANPSAIGSPASQWLRIVDQMIARRHLTAADAAEAYALTSAAIADALIGSWKEKYRSMVVRPVTYVHRVFDPRWQSIAAVPPVPEYPSAHATLSGAAGEVLIRLFGDTIAFSDSSQTDTGVRPRSFRSFTQARDEAAVASVYAGVQFVPAVVYGLAQGQCIGERVLGRLRTRW